MNVVQFKTLCLKIHSSHISYFIVRIFMSHSVITLEIITLGEVLCMGCFNIRFSTGSKLCSNSYCSVKISLHSENTLYMRVMSLESSLT